MSKPIVNAALLMDVVAANSPLKAKGALTIVASKRRNTTTDLLLVLDVSGSMKGQGESVLQDSTVHILNNLMRKDDRIAIITFNSGARVHTSWTDVHGTVAPFQASEVQTLALQLMRFFRFWVQATKRVAGQESPFSYLTAMVTKQTMTT